MINFLLIPVAKAAADASMASSSEAIATAVKENVIAGLTSSTFLTAGAVIVGLIIVIGFTVRFFKRHAK